MAETKYEKAMNNYRGDGEGGERLHGLSVGHVLTARDVQDIQDLLGDHNDMCAALPDAHHEGERSAIRRIGGDELLAKWDTLFDREVDQAAEKGLAYVKAKMAELDVTAEKPEKDGINFEAWARNSVRFIREHDMENTFTDWCGGWPCPIKTPQRYVTGTVEGFARRGLKRTT